MGGYLFLCQIGGGGAYQSFSCPPSMCKPFPTDTHYSTCCICWLQAWRTTGQSCLYLRIPTAYSEMKILPLCFTHAYDDHTLSLFQKSIEKSYPLRISTSPSLLNMVMLSSTVQMECLHYLSKEVLLGVSRADGMFSKSSNKTLNNLSIL